MVSTGDRSYDEKISRMLEFETSDDLTTLEARPLTSFGPRERSKSAGGALLPKPDFGDHTTSHVIDEQSHRRASRKSFSLGSTLRKARSTIFSPFHRDTRQDGTSYNGAFPSISNIQPHRLRSVPLGRTAVPTEAVIEEPLEHEIPQTIRSAGRGAARSRPSIPIDPLQGAAARQAARKHTRDHSRAKPSGVSSRRSSDSSDIARNKDRESGIDMTLDAGADGVDGLDHIPGSRGQENRIDPLWYLPSELSIQIMSLLDAQTLGRCEMVSRSWASLASDRLVWQIAFNRKYGSIAKDPDLLAALYGASSGRTQLTEQNWKALYKLRKELAKNWTTANDVEATYLHGHTDSVYCVQFDEDKIITGSRDRTIRVWDMHTFQQRKVIGVPHAYDMDLREHGVTHRLPLPEHDKIRIQRAAELPPDRSIYHVPREYHNASILCLQYDDEICVTGSSDTTLLVWDLKTWQPIRKLEKHSAGVLDIAMDKRLIISCSKDSSLCIWDRQTGRLLQQLTGHRGPVNAVQLRNDLIVSASGEGCAKIWQLHPQHLGTTRAKVNVVPLRDLWSEDRGLACVEFSEDARHILAGGNDQVIYKFNSESGMSEARMEGHENLVRSLYLDSPNGRVISGSYDLSLRVWDFETGKQILSFPQWATSWMLSAKSDYRRIVSTSQDGRVMVLDFAPQLGRFPRQSHGHIGSEK